MGVWFESVWGNRLIYFARKSQTREDKVKTVILMYLLKMKQNKYEKTCCQRPIGREKFVGGREGWTTIYQARAFVYECGPCFNSKAYQSLRGSTIIVEGPNMTIFSCCCIGKVMQVHENIF